MRTRLPFRFPRLPHLLLALPALAAALLCSRTAAAQDDARPGDVSGQVVDMNSGKPVGGAVVLVRRGYARAITDTAGRFVLRKVRPGSHAFEVTALGYLDSRQQLPVEAGQPLVLQVMPNPVILEGLTVTVDRLQSRRRAAAMSVRVLGREQMRNSAAPNLLMFVRERGMLHLASCGGRGPAVLNRACLLIRGRPVHPSVYVDEAPVFGGLDYLEMFDPSEVELVEIYGNGRQVRVYTTWYLERMTRRRMTLEPIFL